MTEREEAVMILSVMMYEIMTIDANYEENNTYQTYKMAIDSLEREIVIKNGVRYCNGCDEKINTVYFEDESEFNIGYEIGCCPFCGEYKSWRKQSNRSE